MKRLLLACALLGCAAETPAYGTRSEECGSCHLREHEAWKSSRLATSTASPVFQALLPRAEAAWGSVARARCVSCHSPGFGGEPSIGCVSCHSAVGNRGVRDGAMVVRTDAPIATSRSVSAPHATEVRSYLSSSDLCGTCHSVTGPGLFVETTPEEARGSGKECIACHMPKVDGHADHHFVGLGPAWGSAAPGAAAVASTELLRKALRLEVLSDRVRLGNVGASHSVPSGVTFLRDLHVDVKVTDATGKVFDLPRVIELGARMTRGGVEVALPTEADRIEPMVLAPGGTLESVIAPAGAVGPLKIEATLRAHAIRASVMKALGLEDRAGEVPELLVTTASSR